MAFKSSEWGQRRVQNSSGLGFALFFGGSIEAKIEPANGVSEIDGQIWAAEAENGTNKDTLGRLFLL